MGQARGILVHAVSERAADRKQATLPNDLLRRGPGESAVSLQVLQDFYCDARSPRKLGLTHEEALRCCQQRRAFTVLELTLELSNQPSICISGTS